MAPRRGLARTPRANSDHAEPKHSPEHTVASLLRTDARVAAHQDVAENANASRVRH